MTAEERFERIELVTAALVEERRKDREESRQIWRDTQRQIQETNATVATLARRTDELATRIDELATRIADTNDTIRDHAASVDARIDKLVSAIGQFLSRQPAAE